MDEHKPSNDIPHGLTTETKEIVEFISRENERNRQYFSTLLKWVGGALAILLAIIAWLGLSSLREMRSQVESLANSEVAKMREEVRKKIDQEFAAGNIQKLIHEAAVEQTQKGLTPLIREEVAAQVKRRVDAEQGTIQLAVAEETKKAVKDLGPTLDVLVRQSTEKKITAAVDPVASQLQQLKQTVDVAYLGVRALAGDGPAFDTILPMAQQGATTDTRLIAQSIVLAVFKAHNRGFYETRQFRQQMTREQLLQALSDPNAFTRKAAVDTLAQANDKSLLPRFLEVMRSDPDLDIRESAFRAFNQLTSQQFNILDFQSAQQWWLANRQHIQ